MHEKGIWNTGNNLFEVDIFDPEYCNKEKVHKALGDNKVNFTVASKILKRQHFSQALRKKEKGGNPEKDMRGAEEKDSPNTRVCWHSPPPHLQLKKVGKGRGAEERQRGWMGKRAFTDDCSPVWAAKVQTRTSFISLQGHCPRREGSCHPALTSLQQASQPLKLTT